MSERSSSLYPARFHRELSPVWLSAVAASRGVAPPAVEGARWCEIGCGQGRDAITQAAANPGVSCLGIDPNPDHIAAARALAEAAGVENARFLHADIRDWEALEALREPFDFILAHGVYSWVPEAVRTAMRRFMGARLAPGGIALLQYMSWPGAATHLALGSLLAGLGPEMEMARRLEILRGMAEAGAGFFVAWPQAAEILRRLARQSPEFVAQEYPDSGVSADLSREMIGRLRAEGLSWIGSARPIENYDDVSLPAKTAAAVAAEPDLGRREILRDAARNQHLRYDLYMRAPRLMTPMERGRLAQSRRFTLLPEAPPPGALRFETAIGPVEGEAAIFAPLLKALAEGPKDLASLAAAPVFGGRAGLVEQALMMLMWAGVAHPLAETRAEAPAAGRLNAILAREGEAGILAAPKIGSGLVLSPQESAARTALARGAPVKAPISALAPQDPSEG